MPDSQPTDPSSSTTERVRAVVCKLSARRGRIASEVKSDASLIDDLDFDSMELVDLSVALESALGLDDLEMERFMDEEAVREGKRFTVAALSAWCVSRSGARGG